MILDTNIEKAVRSIEGNPKLDRAVKELLADQSIDALRHEGAYADVALHPFFVFKGKTIYDPWVNETANGAETDFSAHNDPKQAVEPFSYYGKQKVADFVERIIAIRNI